MSESGQTILETIRKGKSFNPYNSHFSVFKSLVGGIKYEEKKSHFQTAKIIQCFD